MTADFIEGLIDVVKPPADVDQAPPPPVVKPTPPPEPKKAPAAEEKAPEPAKAEVEVEAEAEAKPEPVEAKAPAADSDLDAAFDEAVTRAAWTRRQDFKVLAIFWKARQQDLGAITAKKAAALGGDLGLTIRHENIRKVVRTRLTEKIETSTVADSQPPTFQYEMNDEGESFFVETYLDKIADEG